MHFSLPMWLGTYLAPRTVQVSQTDYLEEEPAFCSSKGNASKSVKGILCPQACMLHPCGIKLNNDDVFLRRDRPRPGPPAPVRRERDASMIGERPADPQASNSIRFLSHQSQHSPGCHKCCSSYHMNQLEGALQPPLPLT